MELVPQGININFVKKMKIAMTASVIVIVISVLSLMIHGGPNLGIDFAGGTLVQVQFDKKIPVNDVRDALKPVDMGKSIIQQFGASGDNEFLIKTERSSSELEDISTAIEKGLDAKFGADHFDVRRVEVVGPKVGAEMREKGFLAIIYAMAGILVYITWRFQLRYAIGAILALVHDVTITVGIFSLLGKEFTLPIIAALLTIIGYSLNDTIVVYDRMRENIRSVRRQPLSEIVNASLNQTLSRTLLTSLTTLVVVLALFVLGGAVIHDFTFALLVGIIIGTYSSIFIASPTVLAWESIMPSKKKRK